MMKRGRILRDTNAGPGMLTVEGAQYLFTLEGMWRSDVPPRTGMMVDVEFAGGAPEGVWAVSEAQLAREQAQRALSGALRHGDGLSTGLKARFGVLSMVMEALMLLTFFVLPCLGVNSGFSGHRYSGWDATALDPATMMTDNHGLLSLLAVVCLLAPVAVPFLKQAWARWLYTAPLAFSVIAVITITLEIQNTGRAAGRAVGGVFGSAAAGVGNPMAGMFSMSVGAYLVLVCALVLATRAFKARATAPAA